MISSHECTAERQEIKAFFGWLSIGISQIAQSALSMEFHVMPEI
jgi:hypothetical protein